jgi:hypothetical protein
MFFYLRISSKQFLLPADRRRETVFVPLPSKMFCRLFHSIRLPWFFLTLVRLYSTVAFTLPTPAVPGSFLDLLLSQFQNSVSFETGLRKSGLKPAFPLKSKVAVPKLEFWNSLYYKCGYSITKLYEGKVMAATVLKCPFYGSEDVRSYGASNGKKRYACNNLILFP